MDINIKEATGIQAITVNPLTIASIDTIKKIEKIAPAAVHIKELNNIDPLTVESLRVDSVRNMEPLNVDRLNVTHVPMVNLTMARMPAMDLNIRRMPPLALGLHQDFEIPSRYTIHTRLLGFEILRFEVHGSSKLVPQERARREQSHTHERSYPDVAAVGNPAIPSHCRETSAEALVRPAPCAPRASDCQEDRGLSASGPRFHFNLSGTGPGRGPLGG